MADQKDINKSLTCTEYKIQHSNQSLADLTDIEPFTEAATQEVVELASECDEIVAHAESPVNDTLSTNWAIQCQTIW